MAHPVLILLISRAAKKIDTETGKKRPIYQDFNNFNS
jgi:hypothetical protein